MSAPKTPSTPPFAAIGACCASGATVYDPWTGERRCEFCGLPVPLPNVAGAALHGAESPEPVPPPILGGQGRDASEVEADAVSTVRIVVLAILSAAILALGVWAAGGGTR